jgi:hypothetical protein
VLGLQIDQARSILVPTAHDEPAIRLDIYKEMLATPAAVPLPKSKNFLKTTFPIRAVAEETIGCGVDLLRNSRSWTARQAMKRAAQTPCPASASARRTVSPPPRLNGQFLLYGGRIDPGKGAGAIGRSRATRSRAVRRHSH